MRQSTCADIDLRSVEVMRLQEWRWREEEEEKLRKRIDVKEVSIEGLKERSRCRVGCFRNEEKIDG